MNTPIAHPISTPTQYAARLVDFLLEHNARQPTEPFVTGQWLQSLTDQEIKALNVLAQQHRKNTTQSGEQAPVTDAFFYIAFIAFCFERKRLKAEVTPTLIDTFQVIVALEHLVRGGFLEAHGPLSVDPQRKLPPCVMTPKGMAAGEQLRQHFH